MDRLGFRLAHFKRSAAHPRLYRERDVEVEGRIHERRALAACPCRGKQFRGKSAEGVGGDPRQDHARFAAGARFAARDRSKSGRKISNAGEIRARSHTVGAARQNRSRYRARQRDSPRHAGAFAPDEKQSGADRRTGCWQDRHRGRTGASEGSVDASNMLKPMLARGELRTIGATTLDEYRKYIEKDAALERRFQPVMVNEPSVEDTIAILRGLKERYEVHHGVRITDAALVAAAVL